jgi:hypothetical protein
VQTALMDVRFQGNNGHDAEVMRSLLMTQSGHRRDFISIRDQTISLGVSWVARRPIFAQFFGPPGGSLLVGLN